MLSIIGFIIVWIISSIFVGMIIQAIRVKAGADLNDATTAFLEGFTMGPIGILSGLSPREQSIGRGTPRIIGGVAGTILAYNIYQAI